MGQKRYEKPLYGLLCLFLLMVVLPARMFGHIPSSAEDETDIYQLYVWMKNGEKTGYLSTDRPQFRLVGDVVKFSTDKVEFDIQQDELDKFTFEQVLPEHPTDISLDSEVKVGLGQKVHLIYTLTPADAQTKVTWLNSNPDVISITDDGWLTGLRVGTATLTAQTSNGLRAECVITVPEPCYMFYVWLRDGGVEGYAIEDKPLVAMGEEFFTLTTNKSVSVTYLVKDVLKFTLGDIAATEPPVGVERLVTKPQEVTFHEGEITFSSVRAGSVVSVYDMQGRLVETFHADADGTLNVPLHAYPKGLYIIKTEKSSYKIMKK